jgi:amicoumacin kinase
MAFEWAPGTPFDKEPQLWGPSLFQQWGALMGKIHRLILQAGDYQILLHRLRSHESIIASLPLDDSSYGLIHNDFHPGNQSMNLRSGCDCLRCGAHSTRPAC